MCPPVVPDGGTVTREDNVATVVETVDLISKKWHPAIIQTLIQGGPLRYSELKSTLEGISGKVLTESLDDLVEKGLVDRTVVSESPRRVEYELTPHGHDLQGAIEALVQWGDRHLGETETPTVLIVDDDPRLAKMHGDWLDSAGYEVKRAHDGREALRALSEDVAVVLLDRRMPGLSGDEVLSRIEGLDQECAVVMLTAVEPDFDVVDMGFDDYVVKPGFKDELVDVVEDVLQRAGLDDPVREYLALSAKRRLLEGQTTVEEREASEEYRRLVDRLEELETQLGDPEELVEDSDTVRELLANDA